MHNAAKELEKLSLGVVEGAMLDCHWFEPHAFKATLSPSAPSAQGTPHHGVAVGSSANHLPPAQDLTCVGDLGTLGFDARVTG